MPRRSAILVGCEAFFAAGKRGFGLHFPGSADTLWGNAARRNYVRSVFQSDLTQPSGYDLTINVATVPLETAIEAVSAMLHHQLCVAV